jgi:hypothetical protein
MGLLRSAFAESGPLRTSSTTIMKNGRWAPGRLVLGVAGIQAEVFAKATG